MSYGQAHGTDCFEVESFLKRNEVSKLYKVRSKENGQLFVMEVETRNTSSETSPYVQESRAVFSQFLVNLRFTFQTRSKFYYILEYFGGQSLASLLKDKGSLPEFVCRFYACEIIVALEELQRSGVVYKELELENVLLDHAGHVVLWRSFCGKEYWNVRECVCSQHRLPCGKKHQPDSACTEDWRALGGVICAMLSGENCLDSMQQRETGGLWQPVPLPCSLSACASDLIRVLVRGEVSHIEQIKAHPFFSGVDWNRVKSRMTPVPTFPWYNADPHLARQRSDSALSGTHRALDTRQAFPSYNHTTEPYIGKENIHTYSPDIRERPQSPYDYNERETKRYRPSSPLIGRPVYNAHSTPDLAVCFQGQPVGGPSYLSTDRGYQTPTSPVHLSPTSHGIGDRMYPSRSLTDLSNLSFEPPSPRPLHPAQRTSSLSDIGSVSSEVRARYPGEAVRPRSPFAYDHRSLSDPVYTHGRAPPSYGSPYGYHSEVPIGPSFYGDDRSYSGRSSPAPMHPGNSFMSHNGYPQSPRDHLSPRRSFSRETDHLRGSDRVFSHYPNEQSYFLQRSSSSIDLRAISPLDESFHQEGQRNRTLYPKERSAIAASGANASERSTNVLRDSNEIGREKPSLSRARSCSEVEREQRKSGYVLSNKRESRGKYPLAQMPIPSFKEFKERRKQNNTGAQTSSDVTKDGSKQNTEQTLEASSVKTTHAEVRSPSPKDQALSSLYESVKDIGGQNTKEISESKPSSPRSITPRKASIGNLSRVRGHSRALAKSLLDTNKPSEVRPNGYFGKNEVLHSLMMKYGLYDRNATRTEKARAENGTERQRSKQDKEGAKTRDRETEKAPARPADEQKSTMSTSRRTSKSPLYSHRSAQERPLGTPRGTQESTLGTPRVAQESPLGTPSGAQERPSGTPRGTQESPIGTPRGTLGGLRSIRKSDAVTSPVLANLLDKYKLLSPATTKERGQSENAEKHNEIQKRISPESKVETKVNEVAGSSPQGTAGRSSLENTSVSHRRGDLDSKMTEILKARLAAVRKKSSADKAGVTTENMKPSSGAASTMDFYKTSRVVMSATKFRLNKNKSPSHSPGVKRKENEETSEAKSPESTEKAEKPPEKDSRSQLTPRAPARLQRGGIHTSLLSLSSSICSADDVDTDDGLSLYSEADVQDRGRGRGRRWESFHSNISADSGSAHMFEFDTVSAVTEYGDVFDENELLDERSRAEVDVERTDSGVGGDMGQTPRLKKSWEDIVQKSSEHWSVVASSARHWQEMARRRRAESQEGRPAAKKKLSVVITEDMVECPDCLKHYLPSVLDREQQKKSTEVKICPKCKDRRVERKEAIIELVQTEINYGNDLQILKEEFYIPMQSGGILSPENLAAIFLNLQELLEVNTKFCTRLQKSLEESVASGDEEFSNVNVGGVFLESVEFFQAYEIYCSKQNSASSLLDSLQKKSELLKIFLTVTCRENPKCRKMDLSSFLLAPVQRIMKYPLMLSRICKTTPRKNTDRDKLKLAQRKIEEQLNRINALNTAVESRQKRYRGSSQLGNSDALDKLQMKKMASDILNWTLSEMQLLLHGTFQVIIHEFGAGSGWNRRSSKKAFHVFVLFCIRGLSELGHVDSDDDGECPELLFPGEGEVTDAAVVMLRKKTNGKYTLFKDPLMLDTCVVCRDSERKDAFELVLMNKESYVFKAATSKEYRSWLKQLRTHSKDLGAWKRRRNGLPNIMIKNL